MRNSDFSRGTSRPSACAATLSYDEALAILIAHTVPLTAETIPLDQAGGRVLAEPLLARIDSPRRAVAAMDGYAVRSGDLEEGVERFAVRGLTVAGDVDPGNIEHGQTQRIMTGAAMPAGGDVVLPWEAVTVDEGAIVVACPLPRRRHVRTAGCDFARGTELLSAGIRLGPGALALAAAGNHGSVTVRCRPRVGIIASGNELFPPGAAGGSSHCPDSLSLAIAQLALEHHGVVADRILLADDPLAIARAARCMIPRCDVLVMIGGAAQGDRDFAKAGLADLGLVIAFANVAMKPGKPVWYGRIGTTHILGLPGNPSAAMITGRLFLAPLLAALSGGNAPQSIGFTNAALADTVEANGGRESFLCARLTETGVRIIPEQTASGHLALACADALVRRDAEAPAGAVGDMVQVLAF